MIPFTLIVIWIFTKKNQIKSEFKINREERLDLLIVSLEFKILTKFVNTF